MTEQVQSIGSEVTVSPETPTPPAEIPSGGVVRQRAGQTSTPLLRSQGSGSIF